MIKLRDCKDADINLVDIDKVEKSKSKKLMKIGKLWFFIQRNQTFTMIYEISTKKSIMAPGNYAKGLNLLVSKISEIEDAVDEYFKEFPSKRTK